MNIRVATTKDSAALVAIYAPYVIETAITFEYDVPSVADFEKRIENTLKKYPYLVAEENEEIIGYAYAGAYKDRRAYDWSSEITLYVQQSNQKQGVGARLYQALEESLKKQHVTTLVSCITAGNAKSEAFHQKQGFKQVALFPKIGYKFGKWHDVSWMQKSLPIDGCEVEPFRPFDPQFLQQNID